MQFIAKYFRKLIKFSLNKKTISQYNLCTLNKPNFISKQYPEIKPITKLRKLGKKSKNLFFFFSFEPLRSGFCLVVKGVDPPFLSGPTTKKHIFFAVSSHRYPDTI